MQLVDVLVFKVAVGSEQLNNAIPSIMLGGVQTKSHGTTVRSNAADAAQKQSESRGF